MIPENTSAIWEILIPILTGAIGLFLGAYLKKKAENFATKEDFDLLLEQLKKTTSETESIKIELSKGNWLHQQSWQLKEKYYSEILNALYQYKQSVSACLDFYMVPGSEYSEGEIQKQKSYIKSSKKSKAAWEILEQNKGAAEIVLHKDAIEALNKLRSKEWQAFNFEATHDKEYLKIVLEAAIKSYEKILKSAKNDLGRKNS